MTISTKTTIFCILSLLFTTAFCDKTEFEIIPTFELKQLFDQKKEFVLIDARSVEEYAEAHVIKAINVPANEFEAHKSKLPKNKETLLITYCNGVQCGKSFKAAKFAKELGYTNILVYKEGFPVWEEVGYELVKGAEYGKKIETKKLTATELSKIVDAGDEGTIVVDVRDPKEFNEGHIKDAINVPVAEFAKRSGEISKKKKVVVYCNTGSRSYLAYKKLVNMDYKNIYQSLFADWKKSKLEIVTSTQN